MIGSGVLTFYPVIFFFDFLGGKKSIIEKSVIVNQLINRIFGLLAVWSIAVDEAAGCQLTKIFTHIPVLGYTGV